MRLIKPYFEIIGQQSGEIGIFKHIETCGRVAWKSEERITDDSHISFVNMLKGVNHGSVLEHGTVYLKLDGRINLISGVNPLSINQWNEFISKYESNKYSKVTPYKEELDGQCFITTNYRVLIENGWLDDLKYQCEPTEFHEKRITVKFVCTIGVSREFNRHRVHSITEQSTRYCNYTKDKFNNEVTFIKPCWLDFDKEDNIDWLFINTNNDETFKGFEYNYLRSLKSSEDNYFSLIKKGWKPQQAREVLPLNTATELIHTAFVSDWKHFFMLRTAKGAHPQAQELATPLYEEFKKLGLCL